MYIDIDRNTTRSISYTNKAINIFEGNLEYVGAICEQMVNLAMMYSGPARE